MFTAALFTIAKTRKQPKCLLMDEWVKKIYVYIYVCIHTHTQYYWAIKRGNLALCEHMDGPS